MALKNIKRVKEIKSRISKIFEIPFKNDFPFAK